jgi:hypothetical protein
LSLYWMLLGMALTSLGLTAVLLGAVAQVLFDYTGRFKRRWLRILPYTRTVFLALALVLIGVGLLIPLVVSYVNNDYHLESGVDFHQNLAVLGLMSVLSGFLLFSFTLLLHGAVVATHRRSPQ